MGRTEECELIWTEKEQREDFFSARAKLQEVTDLLVKGLQEFKEIKDKGSFTTIDEDLKNTLLAWETILITARTSINQNADIVAVYNWRP